MFHCAELANGLIGTQTDHQPCHRVLAPGKYALVIVGDNLFVGQGKCNIF